MAIVHLVRNLTAVAQTSGAWHGRFQNILGSRSGNDIVPQWQVSMALVAETQNHWLGLKNDIGFLF